MLRIKGMFYLLFEDVFLFVVRLCYINFEVEEVLKDVLCNIVYVGLFLIVIYCCLDFYNGNFYNFFIIYVIYRGKKIYLIS